MKCEFCKIDMEPRGDKGWFLHPDGGCPYANQYARQKQMQIVATERSITDPDASIALTGTVPNGLTLTK